MRVCTEGPNVGVYWPKYSLFMGVSLDKRVEHHDTTTFPFAKSICPIGYGKRGQGWMSKSSQEGSLDVGYDR